MKQLTLGQELEQYKLLLAEVVRNWRIGNDQKGLQNFTQSIQQMERILNTSLRGGENKIFIKIDELKLVLENLYLLIKNNDVVGITDLLEYQLIPLIQAWEEEVKINEGRK